jgi:hypothetical protein
VTPGMDPRPHGYRVEHREPDRAPVELGVHLSQREAANAHRIHADHLAAEDAISQVLPVDDATVPESERARWPLPGPV